MSRFFAAYPVPNLDHHRRTEPVGCFGIGAEDCHAAHARGWLFTPGTHITRTVDNPGFNPFGQRHVATAVSGIPLAWRTESNLHR